MIFKLYNSETMENKSEGVAGRKSWRFRKEAAANRLEDFLNLSSIQFCLLFLAHFLSHTSTEDC